MTLTKILLQSRTVHLTAILLAVFLMLVHIYCLPAYCEDAYFIPRTSRQFHLDYHYAHNAGKLCVNETAGSDVYTQVDVVIMVLTMSKHVAERQAIRDTYGSVARGKPWPATAPEQEAGEPDRRVSTVRVVFLMGQTKDPLYKATEAETVARESRMYGDVVQWEGLVEDYSNLTLKVLLGLRWVRDLCPRVRHVVKTDDDVFIHVPRLLHWLQPYGSDNNFIFGSLSTCHATEQKSGYSNSQDAYPLPSLPLHVNGAIYSMGTQLALHLLSIAPYMPLHNMEDVFVTGTLACVVGADHNSLSAQQYDPRRPVTSACEFSDGSRLAARTSNVTSFSEIWGTLSKPELCSGLSKIYFKIIAFFRPLVCPLERFA